MKCLVAERLLSEYIDGTLDAQTAGAVRTHIEGCPRCAEHLRELESTVKGVAGLPKMRPPGDFLEQVHRRIERESEFKEVIRGAGFFKRHTTPLKAAGVLVSIFFVVVIYKIISPEILNQTKIETPVMSTEREEARVTEHLGPALAEKKAVVQKTEGGEEKLEAVTTPTHPVVRTARAGEEAGPALAFERTVSPKAEMGEEKLEMAKMSADRETRELHRFLGTPIQRKNNDLYEAESRAVLEDKAEAYRIEEFSALNKLQEGREVPLEKLLLSSENPGLSLRTMLEAYSGTLLGISRNTDTGLVESFLVELPKESADAFLAYVLRSNLTASEISADDENVQLRVYISHPAGK